MKTIAIFYQGRKEETAQIASQLVPTLHQRGYSVRSIDIRDEGNDCADASLKGSDMAIVLGGDGTIINAARICSCIDVPILGVNFGRVGFLTELEPHELNEQLPHYLNRDRSIWIDRRSMLRATLSQDGQQEEFTALNDIVIARGTWPRVVHMQVWIDNDFYNTTYADGMIISTATGSTAYNMAVGGPLLHPQVKNTVLTPIAPHLAFDRSLILPPEATIKLKISTGSQPGVFSADGQMNRELQDNATVTVQKSQYEALFLRRRPPTNFYRIINVKLSTESAQQATENVQQNTENHAT